MDTLGELVTELEDLPSIPEAVNRLLAQLAMENTDDEAIEATIIHDTGLSLSVLRAANSASLGASEQVRSVKQAIARLGSRNLRKVVLAYSVGGVMTEAGIGYGLSGKQARLGGVAGAVASEMIASRSLIVDPGEAFTAALVRDCGKMVMDRAVGVETLQADLARLRDGEDQLAFERERYGFDHAQAGAALAGYWGLPAPIPTAIGQHHAPPEDNPEPLVDVVYAGDVMATQMGYGVGLDGLGYRLDETALKRAGLDVASFCKCLAELRAGVEAFQAEEG